MENSKTVIEDIFKNYFSSGSKGTDNSYYEISVNTVSKNNSYINAEVHFKNNCTYCCSELTCHFSANWERIREIAMQRGLTLSKGLTIEFKVFVEQGAKFTVHKSVGLPEASNAYQYIQLFSENQNKA